STCSARGRIAAHEVREFPQLRIEIAANRQQTELWLELQTAIGGTGALVGDRRACLGPALAGVHARQRPIGDRGRELPPLLDAPRASHRSGTGLREILEVPGQAN